MSLQWFPIKVIQRSNWGHLRTYPPRRRFEVECNFHPTPEGNQNICEPTARSTVQLTAGNQQEMAPTRGGLLFFWYKMGKFSRKLSKYISKQSKMKIEKFQTVKDQTTKVRTIPKRKRTSLRENIEAKRTTSLEAMEKVPNITENEVKFQLKSIKMKLDIEDAQDHGEKIITGLGSCLDILNDIQKRCQAARKQQ